MKQLIYVLVAGALLAISSCAKDGKDGTNGTNGTNASTAYQITFTAQPSDWSAYGTSGTAGCYVATYCLNPYLSVDSVGTGAVLVYHQYGAGVNTINQELPYIDYNSSGTQFNYQFFWNQTQGDVVIHAYNSLFSPTTFSGAMSYVIVVIPGYKSLPAGVDRNDYNSIVKYFHPRRVN